MSDKVPSLKKIWLHMVTLVTYSKLGTTVMHEEVIYIAAPLDVKGEEIERAARNFCYQNDLTVSSIKSHPVHEQPTFEIAEVDRGKVERNRLQLTYEEVTT